MLIIITFFGGITAFFAATSGAFQNDLKRVIAYSTCSQLLRPYRLYVFNSFFISRIDVVVSARTTGLTGAFSFNEADMLGPVNSEILHRANTYGDIAFPEPVVGVSESEDTSEKRFSTQRVGSPTLESPT